MRRFFQILAGPAVCLSLTACFSPRERTPPPPKPTVAPLAAPATSLRLPPRGSPVTGFERLAGWTASSGTGAAELYKNTDRPIWGSAAAEIRFLPAGAGPHRVTLTPDEPWRIQSVFNTILLWVWHEGEAGLRKDHAILLRARDDLGTTREWELPYSPKAGWQMLHLRVREPVPWPVKIESLRWRLPAGTTGPQILFLESLSIYQEVLGRIPQKIQYVRPHEYAPAFAPQRPNSVRLDFPSGPAAFRPSTREERFIEKLERLDAERFRFTYESGEGLLTFDITPKPGAPSVGVSIDGQAYPGLWRHFGVESTGEVPTLRFARIDGDLLFLQYTRGLHYELSLHGRTLQLEIESLSENIRALDLGTVTAPDGYMPRVLRPPFLRLREDRRWPLFSLPGREEAFLLSVIPDWWYSLAGRYEPVRSSAKRAGLPLGRMVYPERWRGSRNMFRERVYFTVSNRLEDILPSPAAPESLFLERMRDWIWLGSLETGRLDVGDPLDGLAVVEPEEGGLSGRWRTGNVPAGPGVSITSVPPTDEAWEDDLLARSPRGEWLEHPDEGYVIKSGRFDEFAIDRVRKRHAGGPDFLYLPRFAAHPPWRYTDYDVRMTGAGSYTQTWAEAGAFLQQAAAETGAPVVGAGGSEWLWAGLVAGMVPTFPHGLQELHPFLPQVAWRNIHPFSDLLGLGGLEGFRLPEEAEPRRADQLNRLLATQLAYGAVGRLPYLEDPELRRLAHRLQKPLRTLTHGRAPERIAYWDGERFLNGGEAIHSGALTRSRLYIRLKEQIEIWVNGDFDSDWTVRVDSLQTRLPPFGFVVRGEGCLILNGRTEEGHPLSLTLTPETLWIRSPEQRVSLAGLGLRGELNLRFPRDGGPAVLQIHDWRGEIRISAETLGLEKVGTVEARDAEGKPLSDVEFVREGGDWVLRSPGPPREVKVYREIRGEETNFLP